MTATPVSLAKVAQAYTAIRDARTAKRHAWEKEDEALEADQDKLKALMLQVMNESGAQSVRTDYGTIYRTQKLKPSAADWNAFYDWVMQDRDRFEAIEKRIKATFIQQYMDDNNGELPPGVNAHREYEVAVRRPNNSTGAPSSE